MNGPLLLAWRHAGHHRGRTLLLAACIGLALYLPVAAALVARGYEDELTARAGATPLVVGARGNRFDLTLDTLYFRRAELDPLPWSALEDLTADGLAVAIPVALQHSARGRPLVGVGLEYFGFRGLEPARGSLPLRLGDAVLGARLAEELGLGPGDTLYSDPRDVYDISRPDALALTVRGVLSPRGTPDDHVVFVDVRTVAVLEGLLHGHADAADGVDPALQLARAEQVVMLSPALVEHNTVDADTLTDFHGHGDLGSLPLSAAILLPRDAKAATLLATRINAGSRWQAVRPAAVVDDLLGFVFRVKALFDGLAGLLLVTTSVLVGLVLALSMRLRAAEMETLHRIGCGRRTVAWLHLLEVGSVTGLGAVLAGLGLAATVSWLPRLTQLL